jgi:hypothetical protein
MVHSPCPGHSFICSRESSSKEVPHGRAREKNNKKQAQRTRASRRAPAAPAPVAFGRRRCRRRGLAVGRGALGGRGAGSGRRVVGVPRLVGHAARRRRVPGGRQLRSAKAVPGGPARLRRRGRGGWPRLPMVLVQISMYNEREVRT